MSRYPISKEFFPFSHFTPPISVFQLIVGILAITSFVILGFGGENITKWIVTLILSVAFVVLGIIGIIDYKTNK